MFIEEKNEHKNGKVGLLGYYLLACRADQLLRKDQY
jgi:hypothetical protein